MPEGSEMSQELIAILGVGVVVVLGVAGTWITVWRESGRIRKEASEAHEKIGNRIDGVEESLSARIGASETKIAELTGYIRGWFRQDVPD
ncbi:MAG: hypothetical protein OXN92_00905 [Gammaproteobacteria bacterium]|nr:hypothetical protein [Gammaproteobacteria bacterium]